MPESDETGWDNASVLAKCKLFQILDDEGPSPTFSFRGLMDATDFDSVELDQIGELPLGHTLALTFTTIKRVR